MRIWYKSFTLIVLMLIMLPSLAFAHTHMTDSDPQDGEMINMPLNEIKLFFETSIESLSTFELFNEQNESIPVDIIIDHDTMIGQLDAPLSDGKYIVQWDIIGLDGHPMKGEFSFEVIGQEPIVDNENDDDPTKEDLEVLPIDDALDEPEEVIDDELSEDSDHSEKQTNEELLESSDSSNDSPIRMIVIIGALFVLVIVGIWRVARRK